MNAQAVQVQAEITGLIERVGGVAALVGLVEEIGEREGGEEGKKKLSVYVPHALHNQIRAHAYLRGGGLSEVAVAALRLYVRVAILTQSLQGYHRKRDEVVTKPAGEGWPDLDGARLKSGPAVG